MARWVFMFLVALLVACQAAARVVPGSDGVTDQKNFVFFGGVGSNGIPFGSVGGIGTGPNGGFAGVGGGFPGGLGGGFGGGAGGAGNLPYP